jgi:hypothetical protein
MSRVNEKQHREYFDGLIEQIKAGPSGAHEDIKVSKPIEQMLDVLFKSKRLELYREYLKKFKDLGFNFDSLPKDDSPIIPS